MTETTDSLVADRSVVLTGFMATGKSTIGRLLADRLAFEFVDTDELIERQHGPIADIFATRGEAAFRAIERDIAASLAGRRRIVVSTGGRMMLDPANIAALTTSGRVFCLVASPETILARVSAGESSPERPLLAVDEPGRRIAELLAERAAGYRRFPRILTDTAPPEEVADELARLVRDEPARIPVGETEIVVGVAILSLLGELADVDTPIAVITDGTAAAYVPLLPAAAAVIEVDQGSEPADLVERVLRSGAGAIVALGGDAVAALASAVSERTALALVVCPTDVRSLGDVAGSERGMRPGVVIVDVGVLQAHDRPTTRLSTLVADTVGAVRARTGRTGR